MEESTGPRPKKELERVDESEDQELEKAKEEIRGEIKQFIDQLLERDPQFVAQFTRIRRSFSGPLPLPDHYAKYEEIHPGSAERIMSMAEKEQDHRHSMDRDLIGLEKRGQNYAFGMGVLTLIAGVLLVVTGSHASGVALMFLAISTLVGSFVVDRLLAKKDGSKRDVRED